MKAYFRTLFLTYSTNIPYNYDILKRIDYCFLVKILVKEICQVAR